MTALRHVSSKGRNMVNLGVTMIATRCRRRFRYDLAAFILAVPLISGAAYPALADCGHVSLNSFSSTNWAGATNGYDPLDSTNYAQPINFTVTKTGNDSCTVIIGATTEDSDSGWNRTLSDGSNTLNFNLYTDSQLENVFKSPPNAAPGQYLAVSLGGNQHSATLTFYYNVPPQQLTSNGALAPMGTYTQQVTFYAYTGWDSRDHQWWHDRQDVQGSATVTFQAHVQPDMQVSVVPAGQSFNASSLSQTVMLQTIDLQTSASASVNFWVRANTGFSLQISSQNRGVMRYSANPSDASAVPYTLSLRVNGGYVPVNLSNSYTLSAANGPTGIGGNDYPISIAVNSLSNTTSFPLNQELPLAGNYADVITITGIAQ